MGDRNVFLDRFIELRHAMLQDGLILNLPLKIDSDIAYLRKRVDNEGFSFVKVTLPQMGRALDKGLISGTFVPEIGHRVMIGTRIPLMCHGVYSMIFNEQGTLRPDPCVVSIQWLRQFLSFDAKLEQSFSSSDYEIFASRFESQQQTLRRVKVSDYHPIVNDAKSIITSIFSRESLDTMSLMPSHGPGAVAEKKSLDCKYIFDTWPKKAERLFPYLQYGCIDIRYAIGMKPVPLLRICETRACLVPKDYRGPRLISIEPAAMQYLQQAMMRRLTQVIHYRMNSTVRLDDQNHNRRSAAKACDNQMSTVDLTSASDTLSAVLIWHLFSQVPDWRRALLSLRSDFVGFPTKSVRLVAMSPMGSAICFPLQTIVFASLAIAVTQKVYMCGYQTASRLVRCYGDDIIIPLPCTDLLISVLRSIGCEPNAHKTCYRTPFRESCGGEWFSDVDVSIVRNKHYDYHKSDLTQHPVLLSLQRKFFLSGWYNTARWLLTQAKLIYPVSVIRPRLPEAELYGYSDVPEFSGTHRYNKDLQVLEFKTPCVLPRTQKWESDSKIGLTAKLISNSFMERFSTRDTSVKLRWRVLEGYAGVTGVNLS